MPRCPFCENENAPGAERCASCGAALTTIAAERDDDNPSTDNPYTAPQTVSAPEQSIRELLAAGRKIEAIKLYREQTGAGLKEAKDAVEAIEQGAIEPFSRLEYIAARALTRVRETDAEMEQLLRANNFIGAIKLYRERTGVGLKEAKDAVESFAAERNIPSKNIGCGASALVALALTVAVVVGLTIIL
jgi:ribosomal protein L7/L12